MLLQGKDPSCLLQFSQKASELLKYIILDFMTLRFSVECSSMFSLPNK